MVPNNRSQRPSAFRRLAVYLLITCAVITSGCSSNRLAYRYADWAVVWWVEDYLTLNEDQSQQLQKDLDRLVSWHCQVELPRYAQWLRRLEQDLQPEVADRTVLQRHQQQLTAFLPPLLERLGDPASRLLASLSETQVEELAANMESRHRELQSEYLLASPEQTGQARAERIQERAERWLGSLNRQQQDIVAQWAINRGAQTRIWLDGRRKWQEAFLASLASRHSAGFTDRLGHLIEHSEEARGARYRAMTSDSRSALVDLNYRLLLNADQRHWQHLRAEVAGLREDVEALACGNAMTADQLNEAPQGRS
ncbi:MAG: DUF6279 family lipoprotein [Pseudomonadales bacterium]|nr:DUF6279 family lipoprotein [Pseudomonadales bacterium]